MNNRNNNNNNNNNHNNINNDNKAPKDPHRWDGRCDELLIPKKCPIRHAQYIVSDSQVQFLASRGGVVFTDRNRQKARSGAFK